MTARRPRWLSALLGTGLLAGLLAIVSFDHRYRPEPPPETIPLTEVRLYEPPPPPPPVPPDQRDSARAGPALALAQIETPVALEIMDLDVELAIGGLGDLGLGGSGFGDGAGAAFEIVALSELDRAPIVTGAPPIVYPEDVLAQGVEEFVVRVHILLNELGRARLIRIVENPFPSYGPEIEDFVSQVIFSPPTRLGIPVRAEYLWPLLIRCTAACEDRPAAPQAGDQGR